MNTLNGNFIEKSIPNTKNATLTVNIGGVDSTMTVEKFAAQVVTPETLDIIANGTITTSSAAISYQATAIITEAPINGKVSFPVIQSPSINMYGESGLTATSVEFSNLIQAYDFRFAYFNLLESLSCPELKASANTIQFSPSPQLKSVKFPKLISTPNMSFGGTPLLTEVDFSSLETCNGLTIQDSTPGIVGFYESYFPSLTKGGFNMYTPFEIFEIELPLLTTLTNLSGGFSKVDLPNLVNITNNNISVNGNLNLVQFNIGTPGIFKSIANGIFMSLNNNALSEESVDNLLILLASLDGTNGTTISSNGTLQITGGTSAAPSVASEIAVETLLERGWFISTN